MKLCAAVVALMLTLPAMAADYMGKVTSVADGDTFTMEPESGKVRVRICGIDAPERGRPGYGQAIRRLFQVGASNDKSGNLPAMPGIYPDYPAPIVRNANGGRELAMARWGMPSSQKALMDATKKRAEKLQAKGKTVDFKELLRLEPDSGTTNIRNVSSAHWKRWLGPESRCVAPFTSFSEYDTIDGKKVPVWNITSRIAASRLDRVC
jgi:hypothetical protein